MRALAAIVFVAGCFPTPSAELTCDTTIDCPAGRICERGLCVVGETDGGVDGGGNDAAEIDCTTFNGRHFVGCDIPRPGPVLDLNMAGTYTYNTDTETLTAPDGSTIRPERQGIASGHLISVGGFTVGTGVTLRVVGARPLIVASWSTITVNGVIDVGSHADGIGAGANPGDCVARAPLGGGSSTDGAGGAGGGGYQAVGGNGGNGDGALGGRGGLTATAPLLLGGCPGATGGTGNNLGGLGGAGGGAIQLTALDAITINGTVTAGGQGGQGATAQNGNGNGGGGGGGSGGMIGLESATIAVGSGGVLAANGGGGGGGSDTQIGQVGTDGQASATRANGGGANNAGVGGLGGAGATLTGGNGQNHPDHGGGGAGGSVGFIVFSTPTKNVASGSTVSPAGTDIPR